MDVCVERGREGKEGKNLWIEGWGGVLVVCLLNTSEPRLIRLMTGSGSV